MRDRKRSTLRPLYRIEYGLKILPLDRLIASQDGKADNEDRVRMTSNGSMASVYLWIKTVHDSRRKCERINNSGASLVGRATYAPSNLKPSRVTLGLSYHPTILCSSIRPHVSSTI